MAKTSILPRDAWTQAAFAETKQALCEKSPYQVDGGQIIGRDPRQIPAHEFHGAGIAGHPLLAVVRAKCMDCCVEQADEVRKCVVVACPNWPYRMGTNPFFSQNLSAEERERRAERARVNLKARKIGANEP